MKQLLLALLLFSLSAFAADESTQKQLLAIDSAFVDGHYPQVELLTLRLLQSGAELNPDELSRVDLTTGYALIMLNREPEAREYFRRALEVDSTLTLDPVQVSPKFRMVFDDVKSNFRPDNPNGKPVMQSPLRRSPSTGAMLSTLIIPGSGQWRDGRPLRGAVLFAAQAASVGLLVWQANRLHESHEDYLAQTDPVLIRGAYDKYNRNYAGTWAAGVLVAAVYLAAQTDLIVLRPTLVENRADASIGPGVNLAFRW